MESISVTSSCNLLGEEIEGDALALDGGHVDPHTSRKGDALT